MKRQERKKASAKAQGRKGNVDGKNKKSYEFVIIRNLQLYKFLSFSPPLRLSALARISLYSLVKNEKVKEEGKRKGARAQGRKGNVDGKNKKSYEFVIIRNLQLYKFLSFSLPLRLSALARFSLFSP